MGIPSAPSQTYVSVSTEDAGLGIECNLNGNQRLPFSGEN
jgi:hypothetical protein